LLLSVLLVVIPQGSAVVFCLSNNSAGTTKVAF
jgi:hypothetical protein